MRNTDQKNCEARGLFRKNGVLLSSTILLLVLGASSFVGAQGGETIIFELGDTGSGPADWAWGTFEKGGPTVIVCSPIDPGVFPLEVTGVEVLAGTARFTSSGNPDGGGAVGYSFRTSSPGGPPDQILSEVAFPPPADVALFPETTGSGLPPVENFFLNRDVPRDLHFCLTTSESRVHIPGNEKTGKTVWVRSGEADFQRAQGFEIPVGLDVVVTVGDDPSSPDGELITPIAGFGPGIGTTWFDTEYVSFSRAVGIRLELLVKDELVASDEVGPGEMASGIIGESGLGAAELLGQAGFVFWFPGKADVAANQAIFAQEVIFATLPDGRQFGQFFAAKPREDAQQAGETTLLFTTHDPSRYRVNVGLSSVVDGTKVALTPLSAADGSPAGNTVTMQLDDAGTKQWNDIYSRWNLGDDGDIMIEVEVMSGAVFPYASILDGRGSVAGTSDPTTIMPVSGGAQSVVLLEVGRITGLNEFSGSASLHNHSSRSIVVRVDFHERGVPGVSASQTGEIAPGQTLSWDDAVGDLVGRTGVVGALVFTVVGGGPGGAISGIGREFALFSEGGEITGTAGQLMPGLTPADQLAVGETFHFLGLRDRVLPQGRERSHLGVLNLGNDSVMMTVDGYDEAGNLEGSITKSVRAGEQLRVNNVLKAINSNVDGGLKRLRVTVDGPLYVLAYRVNATGDPVTLQPFRED